MLLNRNLLGIDRPQPVLSDGQAAVTFDATNALAEAAQEAYSTLTLFFHILRSSPGENR